MLEIVPNCNPVQYQRKLTNQTWENGEKPNFEPNFGPFGPNLDPNIFLWVLPLLVAGRCSKLPPYVIPKKTNEPNFDPFDPDLDPNFFVDFTYASI